MWPILVLSIVGWAASAERLWRVFRLPNRAQTRAFAKRVFELVGKGEYIQAEAECLNFDHPVGHMFKTALSSREYEREDLKTIMERSANAEVRILERNFGLIITVIGVEPMLGFLGTITGLINAFRSWEKLAENVTVSALAAGIYEAMITTAAGLIVAIPLYLIYQGLVSRVRYMTADMSDLGDDLLLRLFREPARKAVK